MAIIVKHNKVSTIPDGDDTSVVRPSDWNADHTLTGTVPIANGGTGASDSPTALTNLGAYPASNPAGYGTGTVTSVSGTAPVNVATGTTIPVISLSTTGTGNVVLDTGATQAHPTISDYEIFTSTTPPSYAEGRVWFDSTNHTLAQYNDVTNNVVHLGEEVQLKVINNTGSSIPNGSPVYITGTSSGQTYPNIALAKADTLATSNVIGLTNGAIANGSAGYVTTIGLLNPANTGTFTVGDVLYLSPYSAGQIMNTLPPTGYPIRLGIVAYANTPNGAIYITKTNVYSLASNIVGTVAVANGGTGQSTALTAGGVVYGASTTAMGVSAAGTSGQVLTSQGSGTPTWTTPTTGTVTSVASGTGLTGGPITSTGTLSIANTGVTAGTYGSAAVIPVIAVNSQGQITSISTQPTNAPAYQGTWNASTNTPTLISSVGVAGYYYVVSVAGTTTLNGVSNWNVGDWAIYENATWQKIAGSSSESFTNLTTTNLAVTGLTGYMYANNTSGNVTASTTIPNAGLANSSITINGNATALGGSVSVGTVTSVTATSPVTSTGGTTPVIAMPAATTSVNGYLTSTDWTTFNNKSNTNGTVTSVAALTIGTTGTDLSSTVATGTTTPVITLQVPTASASNRGALSSTDWSTFNGKQAALVSGTTIKTVNGTSLLGSGDVPVGVLTVTGTAPVVSSGGANPAISMPAATTSVSGYLTSTDWNTFNSKGSGTLTSVSGTTGRITSTGGTTPVIDLASGVATAGTTGSSSLIPVVTIDTYGRVTSITTASNPQGTVTSVGGTGTVSGISLSGTVTSSGNLTLGGTLDLSSPPAIGGTAANTITGTTITATKFVGVSGGTF
jgi:hypothetical protein